MDAVSIHEVRPDAFNYVWDNALAPALEIESGEAIELHVRDASDEQIGRDSGVDDVAKLDFSHVNPVSGPVYVKGARPGDVLAVELLEFRPPEWGWTAIIPGFGLLADEYPEPWLRISDVEAESATVRFAEGIALPYRPFPGTIGVAPEEPGEHSIVPPSRFGGNMDTKHLRAGATLFLPVGVDGALFSLGDTHAAQGDGEVCGTAIEAAMDVVVRLSVRRDLSIAAPQYGLPAGALAQTAESSFHVCTGVGPDLMEAARDAVRATIAYIVERYGLDREEAYALASVAADLRIHEVVDAPNWVVGSFVPESIFVRRSSATSPGGRARRQVTGGRHDLRHRRRRRAPPQRDEPVAAEREEKPSGADGAAEPARERAHQRSEVDRVRHPAIRRP